MKVLLALYLLVGAMSVWSSYAIVALTAREYYHGSANENIASNLPLVRMQFEESVHYGRYKHDQFNAKEWAWSFPHGGGVVRQNASLQGFSLVTYHELHCLDKLAGRSGGLSHAAHCLNMLRQSALCHPDLTMEWGDFTKRDFTTERLGSVKLCGDFEHLKDEATRNWLQWRRWQRENPV